MIKKIYFCLALFVILPFLSSCGNGIEGYSFLQNAYYNDNPAAIVVILGNHANAMAVPQDAYDSIENSLSSAVYGGYACAIVADATPTKVELSDEDDFFAEDAKNSAILKQKIEDRREVLIERLKDTGLAADTPEVDLLAAIREAKNALSNSRLEQISDKQIIIVDTGISTTGELNFTDFDFLSMTPEIPDIIEQLKNYAGVGVLPDLTGITVTFIGTEDGLAETAEPQHVPTVSKKYVKELWSAMIEACGADAVRFESAAGWDTPNIYTEDIDSAFPYVSVIPFYHEQIITLPDPLTIAGNDPDVEPKLPDPPVLEVEIASKTVGFKPDRADYLNEKNAGNILEPYAQDLKELLSFYPDRKIWIVGTTASAAQKGGEGSVDLSLRRAETVKSTLVDEFEVPAENLVTVGLGARFPWAVDEWPDGNFDTVIAQNNRSVWLLTDDSDRFQSMYAACESGNLLPESIMRLDSLKQMIE